MLFRRIVFSLAVFALLLHGCIVSGPKYSRVENVVKLELGMAKPEVEKILGVKPYYVRQLDSSGLTVIYKYRATDRRTLPFLLKDTNGQEIRGKFIDLHARYNTSDILVYFESHLSESELKEKKLNINTFITFLTVTAPAFLVYLGITHPN